MELNGKSLKLCIELLSEYGKMNVMLNCHKGFYKRHQTVMR